MPEEGPEMVEAALARAYQRIEVLSDALLDILDVTSGWSAADTPGERLRLIDNTAKNALEKARRAAADTPEATDA